MMDYNEFKERVISTIKEQPGWDDVKIMPKKVEKINGVKDSVILFNISGSENVGPTIYIDDMYMRYKDGVAFTELMEETVKWIEGNIGLIDEITQINETDQLLKNINENNVFFQLVNTEANRELLETVPHRKFQDLSVVYRAKIGEFDDGMKSFMITNTHTDLKKLTEEELFNMAYENTKRILPPIIENLSVTIALEEAQKHMSYEETKKVVEETVTPAFYGPLWLVSNTYMLYGASVMLYKDFLKEIADSFKSNLCILPSSIDDLMVVRAGMIPAEALADMVNEANETSVAPNNRLSYNVYLYSREENTVKMVTERSFGQLNEERNDENETEA